MKPLALNVTPARRRALEVLADAGPEGVHLSNQTKGGRSFGRVCWQCLVWLHREGLVDYVPGSYQSSYLLTGAGRELCRDIGIEP